MAHFTFLSASACSCFYLPVADPGLSESKHDAVDWFSVHELCVCVCVCFRGVSRVRYLSAHHFRRVVSTETSPCVPITLRSSAAADNAWLRAAAERTATRRGHYRRPGGPTGLPGPCRHAVNSPAAADAAAELSI